MADGTLILGALATLPVAVHLATCGMAAARYVRPLPDPTEARDWPFISLIRPLCGVDQFEAETLRSSFTQDYPDYEVLLCVEDDADPVIPLARQIMAEYPEVPAKLLIGRSAISGNPKLNNLKKGYDTAQGDILCMTDSNLLLPDCYLSQASSWINPTIGLVSAPAVGIRPDGLWASVECAFLNGNQARWQLAADSLGKGFAQGKTLMWQREVLDAGGGMAALGRYMAEDVASTHLVRRQGLRVRLAQRLFPQPIGHRSASQVLGRQKRWSQLRREGFPLIFAAEIAQGPALPLIALVALVMMGALPAWSLLAFAALWYGAEWALARVAGWPSGPRDVLAMGIRDALLPAIWLAGLSRKGVVWRGNSVTAPEDTTHAGA